MSTIVPLNECNICYEPSVELLSICNNKHCICRNCVNNLKKRECPFCRIKITLLTELEEHIEEHIDLELQQIPENVITPTPTPPQQRREYTCDFCIPFVYFISLCFFVYLTISMSDTMSVGVKVVFTFILFILTICMLMSCKKICT
jgi:hypothetical protein